MNTQPVLIIGGGIGGLTLGVALKQFEIEFLVFERTPQLKPVGSGIMLSVNSVNCLKHLGLSEELYSLGHKISKVKIQTEQGKLIQQIDYSPYCQQYGVSTLCITRADLQGLLAKKFNEDGLQLGKTFDHYSIQNDGNVLAHFKEGNTQSGSILAGADGIHSAVFKQLVGDLPLRYSGTTSFRGLVSAPYEKGEEEIYGEYWACGKRFGILRVNPHQLYWFNTIKMEANHRFSDKHSTKQFIQEQFKNWISPIPALISNTNPDDIVQTDICDRPPQQKWYEGPVVLLGDAIHPTTPNLGQGAGMAIESAIALAICLKKFNQDAFKKYFDKRYPRTTWITNMSWTIGRTAAWENKFLCQLRDAMFRNTPHFIQEKQYQKLFAYDPFIIT